MLENFKLFFKNFFNNINDYFVLFSLIVVPAVLSKEEVLKIYDTFIKEYQNFYIPLEFPYFLKTVLLVLCIFVISIIIYYILKFIWNIKEKESSFFNIYFTLIYGVLLWFFISFVDSLCAKKLFILLIIIFFIKIIVFFKIKILKIFNNYNNDFDKYFSIVFLGGFFIIIFLSLVLGLFTIITFNPEFYNVIDRIQNFILKSILILLFFWLLLPIIFILKINKKYTILYFPIIIFALFVFKEYFLNVSSDIEELKYHIIHLSEILNAYVFNVIYALSGILIGVGALLLVSDNLNINEKKIYNYGLGLVAIFFTIQILLYYFVENISDTNKAVDYKYCYDLYENNDLEKNFENCLKVKEAERIAEQEYYIKTSTELTLSGGLKLEKDPDYKIISK